LEVICEEVEDPPSEEKSPDKEDYLDHCTAFLILLSEGLLDPEREVEYDGREEDDEEDQGKDDSN
jgi:hypothetical protein